MNIEAIKSEVKALPAEERRKLIAFMVMLDDLERPDYAAMLTGRINDQSSERWLTPEQCEEKLGHSDGSK